MRIRSAPALLFAGIVGGVGGEPRAGAQAWRELGPAPTTGYAGAAGRISAIACSATDANRYFVAGADAGVWRTTDGGTTWTALTDGLATTAIGALALDPTNENVVYAGSGEANFANHSRYGLGLYKSIDGGATWRVLAASTFAGRCFSRIVLNPANPQVLYASITRAGGFPTLAAAKGHPQANGTTGVFKSIDGGETWALLAGGLPALDATDLAMDPGNPAVLYAGVGFIFGSASNGVYKTVDAGSTWTRLGGGLPTTNIGRVGLAVAPTDPTRVYVSLATPSDASGGGSTMLGVYKSTSAGASFVLTSPLPNTSTYGWYFGRITASPTNPEGYLAGGIDLVGVNTPFTVTTPPHPDIHAITFDAVGRLVVGCDGGVYRRTSAGGWQSLNAGLGTIQMYAGVSTHPTDDVPIFAGLQDNGSVRRTSESSLTWTWVTGGDGGWTQVNQANPLVVFTESQGTGALYRSTNGGISFGSAGAGITGRNCFLPPYVIDPHNPNVVLYATERVLRSTDGGVSFSPWSADLTTGGSAAIRALAIAPSDSNFVYAATNDGRVLASVDGGAIFALRLTNNPGWPRVTRELVVDVTDPRTVYLAGAVFGAPHVRRSRDAGATWQVLDGDLPDVPVNVVAVDPRWGRARLYAGTDAGVYVSHDDGGHWRRHGRGVPNVAVVDLLHETARGRIVAATQGRGAWAITTYCPADLDDGTGTGTPDGGVTIEDLLFFLAAFDVGSLAADLDDGSWTNRPDGGVTIEDLLYFLARFDGGC